MNLITYASAYAPLAPGSVVLTENIYDGLDLFAYFGSPGGPMDVYVTVAAGVIIQSNDASKPAISAKGFAPGSTVTINNLGIIIGAGGRGASAYSLSPVGPYYPECGQPGGDAIYSSVPLSVATAFGYIFGGGGGGGGAYGTDGNGYSTNYFYPGGGGAGRGPLGGGEVGYVVGNTNSRNATPFVDISHPGGPGVGSFRSDYGTPGFGGNYGAGGHDSTYSGGVQNNNFVPGNGKGGPAGWAINTPEGVAIAMLDSPSNPQSQIRGAIGHRLPSDMDWRSRENPYVTLELGDTANFNLFNALGGPAAPLDVFVIIHENATIYSTTSLEPAFTTQGMPVGSTLFLKMRGRIIGCGGQGGCDRALVDASVIYPEQGRHGGDAMKITLPTTIVFGKLPSDLNTPCGIFAGGGGGGLVRIWPYDAGQSFGGMGGMGGGVGGVGTIGSGSATPLYDRNEVLTNAFIGNVPVKYAVDYVAAEYATPFKNTSGKGGGYGQIGQASSSAQNGVVVESFPGGLGGYAINSTAKITFTYEWTGYRGTSGSYGGENFPINMQIRGVCNINSLGNVLAPRRVDTYTELSISERINLFYLTTGVMDFNLWEALGRPTTPRKAHVYVPVGNFVGASSTAGAAVSTLGMPGGSSFALTYAGVLMGCGGDGGGYEDRDPNEVPNTSIAVASRIGNGKPGGPALRLSSAHTNTIKSSPIVWISNTNTSSTLARPALLGGGGGSAGYFSCDYAGIEGNYQYIPGSVRLGYGGGGGAGGGKGGKGVFANGGDGVMNPYYTTDGRWGDNRGQGPILTRVSTGSAVQTSIVCGWGGYANSVASDLDNITPGTNYLQEKQNANGTWAQSKMLSIFCVGNIGAAGPAMVTV